MALSYECERCGLAGSVQGAQPGTPTLVKCSACGHTFIAGGPLGTPRVQGGARAPGVPVARTATPVSTPVARTTPHGTPAVKAGGLPPLDPTTGPDAWKRTEILPDALPPPADGYFEFKLDDEPGQKTDSTRLPPAPPPRREITRELARPSSTPAPAPLPAGDARGPAFASVAPPPPDRKWVPFAAVGVVGLVFGAVVAVLATRGGPAPAPQQAAAPPPAVAETAPAAKADADPPAPAAEPAPAQAASAPEPDAKAERAPERAPTRAARLAAERERLEREAQARATRERAEREAQARAERERLERERAARATKAAPAPASAVVAVPPAAPGSAAPQPAVFTPPAEVAAAPPAPVVEDAPAYPSEGFRKPTAADPGCVARTLRLPRNVQGALPETVPVRFAVGADGTVSQFSVLGDIPDRRVSEAIWSAVKACRFNPGADARGRPVRLWAVLPIRFASR